MKMKSLPIVALLSALLTAPAATTVADAMDEHRLSGDLAVHGDVLFSGGVTFTPDSSRIIYVADQRVDNIHELFSVPANGGEAVRLSPEMIETGDVLVNSTMITPDSERVLFLADASRNGRYELFGVSSVGGSATVLNPDLGEQGMVLPDGMQLSPDGKRVLFLVVFQEGEETFSRPQLFSSAVDGSGAMALTERSELGGVAGLGLTMTPDSRTVLYRSDVREAGNFELYSIAIGGGDALCLTCGQESMGAIEGTGMAVTADSSTVIFRRALDGEMVELYATPVKKAEPRRLSAPLQPNGDVLGSGVLLARGDKSVLYLADGETDQVWDLYEAPLNGEAPRRWTDSTAESMISTGGLMLLGNSVVHRVETHWHDDSKKSAGSPRPMLAGVRVGDVRALDLETGAFRTLHAPLPAMTEKERKNRELGERRRYPRIEGVLPFPSKDHVLLLADFVGDAPAELYVAPVSGEGSPVRVNGNLDPKKGSILHSEIAPDGKTIIYLAEHHVDGVTPAEKDREKKFSRFTIYATSGSDANVVRVAPPVRDSSIIVWSAVLSPDGRTVAYTASEDGSTGPVQLFHAPVEQAVGGADGRTVATNP